MPYTKTPRPYKKEYAEYHGTEEQKKKRAMRNAARRKLMSEGKVKKGDGMDVHHKVAVSKGGTNKDGLVAVSAARNRSFRRDSQHRLVSETSKKEAAKK